jgi:hypothetical protein
MMENLTKKELLLMLGVAVAILAAAYALVYLLK